MSQRVCKGMFELLMTSYAQLVFGRTDVIMHDLVLDATVSKMRLMTSAEGAMVQGCRELEIGQFER